MAVRGAIRCNIETTLPESKVIAIFEDTLGKTKWTRALPGNPTNASAWSVVGPPTDAATAVEWVRNKREERVHATNPGGFQDSATMTHLGTTIALGFNEGGTGITRAHLFTSTLFKNKKGKVDPLVVATVRNQMKRVAKAVVKEDPNATISHSEDTE